MKRFVFVLLFLVCAASIFSQNEAPPPTYKGIASFYAKKFEGRKTANGEKFSNYDMTCAHRKFKFNTLLKVTNQKNGLSTIVRVNDRGPYVKGRIIDLSEQAARMIGKYKKGLSKVEIEIIEPLPLTADVDSVLMHNDASDCFGNIVQLKDLSVSIWRTKDLQHVLLLADHLYKTQEIKNILIAAKGTGKARRYHLVITHIQSVNELLTVKDYWERKGFMRVVKFEMK